MSDTEKKIRKIRRPQRGVRQGRPPVKTVKWSPEKVYELMYRAGWVADDLAEAVGISTSTVYQWQSKKGRNPQPEQAKAVANALAEALGRRVRVGDLAP